MYAAAASDAIKKNTNIALPSVKGFFLPVLTTGWPAVASTPTVAGTATIGAPPTVGATSASLRTTGTTLIKSALKGALTGSGATAAARTSAFLVKTGAITAIGVSSR